MDDKYEVYFDKRVGMEKRDHYLLMKRSQVDLVTRGILNWIEKQYSQLSYRALLCIDRL